MAKIAVVGEGVIDRFLMNESHTDVIGGSALNTAVAMKRAGADVVWFTRLASDANGKALTQYASAEGVLANHLITGTEPASLVEIQLADDGQPTYSFCLEGAVDWNWSVDELAGLSNGFQVVQISSLSAVLDPGADLILQTVERLRTLPNPPLITYDPNARPSAAQNELQAQQMRSRIAKMVGLSDLVKVSDEDMAWLEPDRNPIDSAKLWSKQGPKLVVLTRGAEGAKAFSDGEELVSIHGQSVQVIDTVGAGDTFMAWLVAQIVNQFECKIPTEIAAVTSLLEKASKAAAITCSRKGCNPPFVDEIL